jgi:hypothetical protein
MSIKHISITHIFVMRFKPDTLVCVQFGAMPSARQQRMRKIENVATDRLDVRLTAIARRPLATSAPLPGRRTEKFSRTPHVPPLTRSTGAMMRTGLLAVNTDALHVVLDHGALQSAAPSRRGKAEKQTVALLSAEDEAQFATRLQLRMWIDVFSSEIVAYRSTAVASELLIQRAVSSCAALRQPHLLTTAVCLAILQEFCPNLRIAGELVKGIIDEVCQAIYVTPCRSSGLHTTAHAFGRPPYFDAFFEMASAYHVQKARAASYADRVVRGERVLTRAVDTWQRGHARRLLQNWRAHTARHKALRGKYKRLFSRCSDGTIGDNAIAAWRRFAHESHVRVLASNNRNSVEVLAAAHAQHRQTEERLKALQRDAARRDRELAEVKVRNDNSKAALSAVRSKVSVVQSSYVVMRRRWAAAVQPLFNDVHALSGYDDTVDLATWVKDVVTEFGLMGANSPHTKRLQPGGRVKLTGPVLLELMQAVYRGSGHLARNPPELADDEADGADDDHAKSALHNATMLHNAKAIAEEVCRLFRLITRGVPCPIVVDDIVRGDQLRVRHFVACVLELFVGGHMSAFFTNAAGFGHDTVFQSRLRDDPHTGAVAATTEISGIMHDWNTGTSRLRQNGQHQTAPRVRDQCITDMIELGEDLTFRREVQQLYDLFHTTGAISRREVEVAVTTSFARATPAAVAPLWPDDGVSTLQDMTDYFNAVSDVALASRWDVLKHVRHYVVAISPLSYVFACRDGDVVAVISSFEAELHRSWDLHTASVFAVGLSNSSFGAGASAIDMSAMVNEVPVLRSSATRSQSVTAGMAGSTRAAATFTRDAAEKLVEFIALNVATKLADGLLLSMYEPIADLFPDLGEASMVCFLCACAEHYEPSPYLPVHAKLRAFLRNLYSPH